MRKSPFLLLLTLISTFHFSFLNAQVLTSQNQHITAVENSQPLLLNILPERNEYLLSYIKSDLAAIVGSNSCKVGTTYYMSGCIDFTAIQMAHLIGGELYKVTVAIPAENISGWTSCKVWVKNSLTGAVQYEQFFTPVLGEYNEITLNVPQTIKAGSFVIGYTITINATSTLLLPFWCSSGSNDPYQQGGFNYIMSETATSYGVGASFYQYTAQGNLGVTGYVRNLPSPAANDLAAIVVTSDTWPKVLGTSSTYTVTVYNSGVNTQNDYTVQLIDDNENIVASQKVTTPILSGEVANINLAYSAFASGMLTVRGKVVCMEDEFLANNITTQTSYYIYPMEPMRYCDYGALEGVGITVPNTLCAAISYPVSAMAPYAGNRITAIEIGLCEAIGIYIYCSVWIRSSLSGQNLYTQFFNPIQGWNKIELTTPFLLPNETVYIGYSVTILAGGYPIGTTLNVQNAAHGGHISTNNGVNWSTLAGYDLSGNNAIIGIVEYVTPPVLCNTVTNLTVNYTPICEAVLSWTPSAGTTNRYNIYRDGAPIASNLTATTYTDISFDPYINHTWSVSVSCSEGSESIPVFETKPQCTWEPVCIPPNYFTVNYIEDCEALLVWELPRNQDKFYNVYRDDIPLVTNLNATSYIDNTFDVTVGHTWSVKLVCIDGESDPIVVSKPACGPQHIIMASAEPNGTIDPSGAVIVNNGDNQVFHFFPDEGYMIYEVLVNGANNPDAVANGAYMFVNVTSNQTIVVSFISTFIPVTDIIDVPENAEVGIPLSLTGTVIPSDATNQNIVWRMEKPGTTGATISDGNLFNAVAVGSATINATIYNGSAIGSNFTKEFIITVTAGDPPVFYTITSTVNDSNLGMIEPLGTTVIEKGGTQIYKITAYDNCFISKVLVNDEGQGAISEYTFENVQADGTIAAIFEFVGINENLKTLFAILPNPAQNEITVTSENNFHTVELISFLGQTILSLTSIGNSVTIDVSNFTSGVYFIRIITADGIAVQKFVKN